MDEMTVREQYRRANELWRRAKWLYKLAQNAEAWEKATTPEEREKLTDPLSIRWNPYERDIEREVFELWTQWYYNNKELFEWLPDHICEAARPHTD